MKNFLVALALFLLPCAASAQQTNMYWQTTGTTPCPSCWSPVSAANPLPVSIGGSSGGVAVFGPTASGSVSANPPVQIGGTATGAAGQNVAGAAVKPASTAAVATDTSLVTQLNPLSPGIIALGPATLAASLPTNINSQYPVNSVTTTPTAVTNTATGTTAATAAALAATASVTNFVCGFTITADATALATGTATLSGTISGSLNYLQTIVAVTSGTSQLSQNFSPCIPASAVNTAITITSAAAGTGGNTIVNIWGYRL